MLKPAAKLVALVCLLAVASVSTHGQTPAHNLRIFAFGGFLGYQDGLVDPESLDHAAGGLFAVEAWLSRSAEGFKRGTDLLLITGNNVPLDGGGANLAALGADAVAFSIDDFLRSLRLPAQAATLARDLGQNQQPPYVVSNGIIRTRKDGINQVDGDGVDLEIDEGATIGWLSSLRASCEGECPDTASARLTELLSRSGAPPIAATVTRSRDRKHLNVALKPSLRPGHRYELTLSDGGKTLGEYHFTTHRALTRVRAGNTPGGLQDWPIQYAERHLGETTPTPLIIIGAVNPDTRKQLGADRWKWSPEEQAAAPCDGTECEIDFLPATDAYKAIASQLEPLYRAQAAPLLILMSGLSDAQTLALVSGGPDIRFVLLDPDASALGRYRGDEAIVNGTDPVTTQLWSRPEWIGAQAAIMRATMQWQALKREWRMLAPGTAAPSIDAARLDHRIDPARREIEYFIKGNPAQKLRGPLPVYPATPAIPDASQSAGSLWVTKEGTAAVILDEVRRYLTADIALLRAHAIDEDIVRWFAAEAKTKPLNWMSRFTLQRLLYQMEHFVSVDIEGSKLADTLDAIVKAEASGSESLFAAGLGLTGTLAAVDKDHLRVNERRIIPTHYYRIALQQSVAESAKLALAGGELASILDRLDGRLRNERESVMSKPALDQHFDTQFARRPRLYLNVSPARFEFHRASIDDNDKVLLANLPLAGRSVSAEEQWAASGFGDLGLDFRRFAVRATADLRYAKKTVEDSTTNPYDEWTAGFRADYKLEKRVIDRLFVGWFAQSWFRNHTDRIATPARTIVDAVDAGGRQVPEATVNGKPVSAFVQRPMYKFTRLGIELSSKAWPWLTFKDLKFGYDFGRALRDRENVRIGSTYHPSQGIESYFKSSKTFLNDWFQSAPELFVTPQTLEFDYAAPRDQRRVQADGALEVTAPWAWAHGMKLSSTLQYRKYLAAERENYTPDWTLDSQTKLEWTAFGRLKFGPFVNFYRVRAKGVDDIMKYRDHGFAIDFPIYLAVRRIPILQ